MKFHLKTFLMGLVLAGIVVGIAAGSYSIYYMLSMNSAKTASVVASNYTKHVDNALKTPLEKAINQSERVNFLIFGTDGGRSDTIMVISYDTKKKIGDIISIPRDTYVDYPSDDPAWHKINSVIERKEGGGPQGLKECISSLLKIPISYYIEIHYSGVKNIVNAVGGVEIAIPFNMNYDDVYCNPPLHIHLSAGLQTLDGDKAIQFLRWRKNNGQGGLGDLPRTQRQQEFLKALISKSIGPNLPAVIEASYSAVETDMDLNKMLFFGTTLTGFDIKELRSHRVPSQNKFSKFYFLPSSTGIDALMLKIYNRVPGQEDDKDSDIVDQNGIVLDALSDTQVLQPGTLPSTNTLKQSPKSTEPASKIKKKKSTPKKESPSTTDPPNDSEIPPLLTPEATDGSDIPTESTNPSDEAPVSNSEIPSEVAPTPSVLPGQVEPTPSTP